MSSSPNPSVRHRGAGAHSKKANGRNETPVTPQNDALDILASANGPDAGSQWDYRLALLIITIMAFATRFYGISHPNEVVFDEVHFGKVRRSMERTVRA